MTKPRRSSARKEVRLPIAREPNLLEIPFLVGPLVDLMAQALREAEAHRAFVAVVAPKGYGKTEALNWHMAERGRWALASLSETGNGNAGSVVRLAAPRTRSAPDLIAHIHNALLGSKLNVRRQGRAIESEELIERLAPAIQRARITVLAIDEGERLSSAALQALRDLASHGEDLARKRRTGAEGLLPGGFGVLLIGTQELGDRLRKWEEAGERLVSVYVAEEFTLADISDFLRQCLPAADEYALQVGDEAWMGYLQKRVMLGGNASLRALTNLIRSYVVLWTQDNSKITSRDDLPFDPDLFVEAARTNPALSLQARTS